MKSLTDPEIKHVTGLLVEIVGEQEKILKLTGEVGERCEIPHYNEHCNPVKTIVDFAFSSTSSTLVFRKFGVQVKIVPNPYYMGYELPSTGEALQLCESIPRWVLIRR